MDSKSLSRSKFDLYKDLALWYNNIMDDTEIIVEETKTLTPAAEIKRQIAEAVKNMGDKIIYSEYLAKKISYRDYLSLMLWEALTMGEIHYLEGQTLKIEKYSDWLDTMKFIANHIDGPVGNAINTQSLNLFKVYMGIDESKV